MGSSIPGAVNYFLTLAQATLPEAYVWFGKQLPRVTTPVTLQVLAVTDITHEWAELGSLYKIEETYKIQCQLVSYAGGDQYVDRMNEVFNNYLQLTIALGADYTMGTNVRLCLPGIEAEFVPGAMQDGKSAGSLMFFIHCEARIQSLS